MKQFKLAVLSDIHLGHKRTSTIEIIKNLRKALPDDSQTAELDMVVLAGDVFDGLLTLPQDEVSDIDAWIAHLLRLCKKHDIMLRVLEGTPSHDWKQSERFVTMNEAGQIGADLKYVKELSIEYVQQHDIHLLYVPDELPGGPEKTLEQVKSLLKARGLSQVDFAFMHGQFEYQLPEHIKAPKHSSLDYLQLVKHLVFIGHVHTHSRFERIIAQGSFDRLSHGEEGPKGHVRATVWEDGTADVVFVENPGAKLYKTVNCSGLDLDETLTRVDDYAKELPPGSHVRVLGDPDNPVFSSMEALVRLHPLLIWSKKVNEVQVEVTVDEVLQETYTPITLTRDNLESILLERMADSGVSGVALAASQRILADCL